MKKILLICVGLLCAVVVLGGLAVLFTYGNINIPSRGVAPAEGGSFVFPKEFASFVVYADAVPNARTMVFAPGGLLMVAQPDEGTISVLPDRNADGKADEAVVVARGLNKPHGLTFRCTNPDTPEQCDLYVAEQDALTVFAYDGATMSATNKQKALDLPSSSAFGAHKTRSLIFLPSPHEDELLIALGSTCNVCVEEDKRFGAILIYHIISGKVGYYATGLRNSVFMTLHPVTGDVWATEMGRDGLGDDIPPDEVNIVREGGWYGWPWFYGKNVEDTAFSPNARPSFASAPTESIVDIPAHSAPLGITFIQEEGWPEEYWFNALVAYHGSWNRSTPTGYKVVRMKFDAAGKYQGTEDFITGWLTADGETIGRPADVLALPGGTVYVSDDQAGKIYKLMRSTQE